MGNQKILLSQLRMTAKINFKMTSGIAIPDFFGSLSTVVGDEKLTSREDRIGPLFMYVQSDEDTLLKVDEVSETKS